MTFAARYRALTVLVAITIAPAIIHLLSVALGAVIGVALPTHVINIVAGIAFLGFAAQRTIRIGAAAVFVAVGVLLILDGVRG